MQETSEELGKLLKSLAMHSKDLEPVQAAVVRDAQRQVCCGPESGAALRWIASQGAISFVKLGCGRNALLWRHKACLARS